MIIIKEIKVNCLKNIHLVKTKPFPKQLLKIRD